MAHFAILEDELVKQVVAVKNEVIIDSSGEESEEIGKQFLHDLLGVDKNNIIQTSYNNNFRGMYASSDYWYNRELDIFFPRVDADGYIFDVDGNIVDHIDPDFDFITES